MMPIFSRSDITEELKTEVQYLAEEYLRQFTTLPIDTSIDVIDGVILGISIEPFRGQIQIYELDKSLHATSMRKWTHSTSCHLTSCCGDSTRQSRYGLIDIIQVAMIDLMDQVQDTLEDLPVGHFGV